LSVAVVIHPVALNVAQVWCRALERIALDRVPFRAIRHRVLAGSQTAGGRSESLVGFAVAIVVDAVADLHLRQAHACVVDALILLAGALAARASTAIIAAFLALAVRDAEALGINGANRVRFADSTDAAAAVRTTLLAGALLGAARAVHAHTTGTTRTVKWTRKAVFKGILVAHPVSAPGLIDTLALLADVVLLALAAAHSAAVVAAFLAFA
jgi:hypothetical protein